MWCIRQATFATSTLMMITSAAAEVCDKAVGEAWQAEHGPVWLLNPVGFPIGLTLLICGLALVAVTRNRWIGIVGAVLLLLYASALVFADLVPQHYVYIAQIREGCRSYRTDLMDLALIATFALAYVWLGHRGKHRTITA